MTKRGGPDCLLQSPSGFTHLFWVYSTSCPLPAAARKPYGWCSITRLSSKCVYNVTLLVCFAHFAISNCDLGPYKSNLTRIRHKNPHLKRQWKWKIVGGLTWKMAFDSSINRLIIPALRPHLEQTLTMSEPAAWKHLQMCRYTTSVHIIATQYEHNAVRNWAAQRKTPLWHTHTNTMWAIKQH